MSNIIENPYIADCDSSTFSVLFNNYKSDNCKIEFIHGLLKYPDGWAPDVDIFQYITNIKKLKKDKNVFFIFDASTEGFCPFRNYFFDILYYNCKKYKINPKKVLFLSTNMKDLDNIKEYNKTHEITNSIHVFPFLSFKKMIRDLVEDYIDPRAEANRLYQHFQKKTNLHYTDKFVLSLSRVIRPHRVMATYLLSTSEIADHAAISHSTIGQDDINEVRRHKWLIGEDLESWAKKLPFTIDTDDFKTNHALTINSILHHQTLFQIVNETHVKDWNKRSIFFSEKTFRSIGHMQPFLIFGQQGCNHALENYGFKLYHDMFDYSFDLESNVEIRYQKLLSTVMNAVNKLKTMTREEQIAWKYSCEETIKHNFNVLFDTVTEEKEFKQLEDKLNGKII